jgi:hypothetical protein
MCTVKQELINLPEHLSSHLVFSGVVRVDGSLVSCVVFLVMVISVLYGVRVMVFNATLNTISAISRRSVLLVEETGVSEENHRSFIFFF